MMNAFFYPFLVTLLVLAAFFDLRFGKIPNLLTYPAMATGVTYHALTGGLGGVFFALGGLLIGAAVLAVPWLLGGMGAGDAKLMGAIGAALGPSGVVKALLYSALMGGIYAVFLILIFFPACKAFLSRCIKTMRTFFSTGQVIFIPAPLNEKKPALRYGVAIALGTLWALWPQWSSQGFAG